MNVPDQIALNNSPVSNEIGTKQTYLAAQETRYFVILPENSTQANMHSPSPERYKIHADQTNAPQRRVTVSAS